MPEELAAPTLRLTSDQHALIVAHCYRGLPAEACGLIAGPMAGGEATGDVVAVYPCTNADDSARSFTVESRDMMRADRDAAAQGAEIVGVWHSHTHTDAYPSPTDVRQAVDPAWVYVIVSLKHDAPVLRAYRIREATIAEVAVEVAAEVAVEVRPAR